MCAGCLLSWALLASGSMYPHEAALLTHSSWLSSQFHQSPNFLDAMAEPTKWILSLPLGGWQTYDSSLWTMPLEAGGSVVLMIIFVGLRCARSWAEPLALAVFCSLTVLFANSYMGLFAFGAALRLFCSFRVVTQLQTVRWIPPTLIVIAAFFGGVPYSNDTERLAVYNSMLAISKFLVHDVWPWGPIPGAWRWQESPQAFWHGIGAMLVLWATLLSPGLQTTLSRPLGRFLGRISFPLYIIHVPLLMTVECGLLLLCQRAGASPVIAGLVSFIGFVSCAVLLAALLSPYIEGGTVNLSAWIGKIVDIQVRRVAGGGSHLLGARLGTAANGRDRPRT